MNTTIYIHNLLLKRLLDSAELLGVSKNKLIGILLLKVINKSGFLPKLYRTVRYQKSDPDIIWKKRAY